jgi:hypothetical protein
MASAVVSVKDAFEIKPNVPGSSHAPGLVVIFDGRQCGFELPPVGSTIELLRPDGTSCTAVVSEMKEHGDGRSFFFDGVRRDDAPVGTILSWPVKRQPAGLAAAAAGRSG